jgi:hypothetical protein
MSKDKKLTPAEALKLVATAMRKEVELFKTENGLTAVSAEINQQELRLAQIAQLKKYQKELSETSESSWSETSEQSEESLSGSGGKDSPEQSEVSSSDKKVHPKGLGDKEESENHPVDQKLLNMTRRSGTVLPSDKKPKLIGHKDTGSGGQIVKKNEPLVQELAKADKTVKKTPAKSAKKEKAVKKDSKPTAKKDSKPTAKKDSKPTAKKDSKPAPEKEDKASRKAPVSRETAAKIAQHKKDLDLAEDPKDKAHIQSKIDALEGADPVAAKKGADMQAAAATVNPEVGNEAQRFAQQAYKAPHLAALPVSPVTGSPVKPTPKPKPAHLSNPPMSPVTGKPTPRLAPAPVIPAASPTAPSPTAPMSAGAVPEPAPTVDSPVKPVASAPPPRPMPPPAPAPEPQLPPTAPSPIRQASAPAPQPATQPPAPNPAKDPLNEWGGPRVAPKGDLPQAKPQMRASQSPIFAGARSAQFEKDPTPRPFAEQAPVSNEQVEADKLAAGIKPSLGQRLSTGLQNLKNRFQPPQEQGPQTLDQQTHSDDRAAAGIPDARTIAEHRAAGIGGIKNMVGGWMGKTDPKLNKGVDMWDPDPNMDAPLDLAPQKQVSYGTAGAQPPSFNPSLRTNGGPQLAQPKPQAPGTAGLNTGAIPSQRTNSGIPLAPPLKGTGAVPQPKSQTINPGASMQSMNSPKAGGGLVSNVLKPKPSLLAMGEEELNETGSHIDTLINKAKQIRQGARDSIRNGPDLAPHPSQIKPKPVK